VGTWHSARLNHDILEEQRYLKKSIKKMEVMLQHTLHANIYLFIWGNSFHIMGVQENKTLKTLF